MKSVSHSGGAFVLVVSVTAGSLFTGLFQLQANYYDASDFIRLNFRGQT